MFLEFHDEEVGNTLSGKWKSIDYDYQAEAIIHEVSQNPQFNDIVRFVLMDDQGERAVWERESGGVKFVSKTERFLGEWVIGCVFRGNL